MFYTYVLQSIHHDKIYVGQTSDLEERIKRHNNRRSKSTKKYAPYKLIAAIPNETRSQACELESKLKAMKNPAKLFRHLELKYKEFIK